MALDKHRLLDQIVFLEAAEARPDGLDADDYLAAARALRKIIESDLADLPMQAFVNVELPVLEVTAQNVFFEGRGRFADLDGSGIARRAQAVADSLLRRLRRE